MAPTQQPSTIGIEFRSHPSGILQLESSRIFVEDEIVRAAMETPGAQPTLTYLVNAISREGRSTPYSFVGAGPVPSDMPDDAVIINQWLSDACGANARDRIDVAYSQLEPNNAFVDKHRAFTVFRVVPMEDLAIERALAPRFPGLSNVENCRDWDIGMPLDKGRLTDAANEAYWKAYGQTPKLLTTFKAGKEMWGTRFGSVMGIRFPVSKGGAAELERTLRVRIDAEKIGLVFAPVRKRALDGVNQAMDFGGLMAGMSAFLIGAALILLGLLYAHGLQQRASEIGVLMAVGYPLRRIRTIFLAEAFPAALAGTVIGAIAGAAYARFLLAALAWLWPDAVAGAAIAFHAQAATLAEGGAIALACTLTIILTSTWRGARRPARELLAADYATMPAIGTRKRGWGTLLFASVSLTGAIAIAVAAALGAVEDLLGAFFSEGFFLLLAGLGYYAGRSLGVAAATACGCFLVLSVSAMRENLALHAARRDSGTGGFAIYAETTVPVPDGGTAFMRGQEGRIVPLRVRNGDDAGCLNLNHAQTPRLIGVAPAALGKLGAFAGQDFWERLDTVSPDEDGPENGRRDVVPRRSGTNGCAQTRGEFADALVGVPGRADRFRIGIHEPVPVRGRIPGVPDRDTERQGARNGPAPQPRIRQARHARRRRRRPARIVLRGRK
ncbi:MAG: FtsX-like permease family protein, partial [Candidatus Hydrogenedentes bacterium]|nr:FtsX-like permease family protein [Candidatus Hydrogenedentota bacterium]